MLSQGDEHGQLHVAGLVKHLFSAPRQRESISGTQESLGDFPSFVSSLISGKYLGFNMLEKKLKVYSLRNFSLREVISW